MHDSQNATDMPPSQEHILEALEPIRSDYEDHWDEWDAEAEAYYGVLVNVEALVRRGSLPRPGLTQIEAFCVQLARAELAESKADANVPPSFVATLLSIIDRLLTTTILEQVDIDINAALAQPTHPTYADDEPF